jgi:hypothetical protein
VITALVADDDVGVMLTLVITRLAMPAASFGVKRTEVPDQED